MDSSYTNYGEKCRCKRESRARQDVRNEPIPKWENPRKRRRLAMLDNIRVLRGHGAIWDRRVLV